MNRKKIILFHILIFIFINIIFFFSSEFLVNLITSGFHDVGLWKDLLIVGAIIIFILTIISCLLYLKEYKLIGLLIIILNIFMLWDRLSFLYRYHFTDFSPTFYIPNWILIATALLSIIGIIVGFKVIKKSIYMKNGLLIYFSLVTLSISIQVLC